MTSFSEKSLHSSGPVVDSRSSTTAATSRTQPFQQAVRLQTLPSGYTITRVRDGLIVEASAETERLLGFKSGELVGRSTVDLGLYPNLQLREAYLQQSAEGVVPSFSEVALQSRNGGEVVLQLATHRIERYGEACVLTQLMDVTERKHMEAKLQQSEERYRSLFTAARDAVILMQGQRIVACNPATIRLFGNCEMEIMRQTPLQFFFTSAQQGSESNLRGFKQSVATCSDGVFAWRHRRKDGTEFDAEVSLSRVEIGGKIFLQAIVRDITDRIRAESALAHSQARLKLLLGSLTDGFVVTDLGGRLVEFNRAYVDTLGYTEEELLRLTYCDLTPEKWHALELKIVQDEMLRGGSTSVYEKEYRKKDGTVFPVELRTSVVRDGKGTAVGLCAIVRDTTERKRAQDILRQTNEYLQALIQSSPLAIIAMDLVGNVTLWNPAAERMLGWWSEEVVGRFLPMVPPEKKAEHVALRMRVLQGESFRDIEVDRWKKDGSSVRLSVTTAPLRDSQGKIAGIMSVNVDITERRKAALERERLQTQLIQAQKMEAVGHLAGGVAHDFNNILTAIMIYLENLRDEPNLSPQIKDALDQLELAANRGSNLTRQLLSFSSRQIAQKRTIEFGSLLGNLLKMLRRLLGDNVALEVHNASEPLWVHADGGMLEQVVMNLVVNARDAMPKGGRITLATQSLDIPANALPVRQEAKPGRYMCLTVTDCGIGMDEVTRGQLFEPFFTTKEPGKGTGLGLATVDNIVKRHDGWVNVESVVGRGTTFKVYLPISSVDTAVGIDENVRASRGNGETILFVEDDIIVARQSIALLRRAGYRVLESSNGPDALRLLSEQNQRIDLLLTDMIMPKELSGLELTQLLRQRQTDLKVIITSGYALEMPKADWAESEGVTFLPKPFSGNTLIAAVRRCLDGE